MILRAAVAVLVSAVGLSSAATAAADTSAPQPGTACPANAVGAMTFPSDAATPVVCDGTWSAVADPYPVSDRWLSYGPAIELHGQGRRNPSMLSGDWIATPSTPDGSCHADQVAVVPGSPTVGPPRVDDGEPGRPLTVQVSPTMASIDISGQCLWQKVVPDRSPTRSGW